MNSAEYYHHSKNDEKKILFDKKMTKNTIFVGNLINGKREKKLPFNTWKSKGDFPRELFISTELFDKVGHRELKLVLYE